MPRLVVHGHSLAQAAGASRPKRGFTRLVARGLGLREVNLAVGGAIAHWEHRGDIGDGGRPAVLASPALPAKPRDAVLLFYGLNDLAVLGRRLDAYEDALRDIVAHALGPAGDARVMVLTQFPLENYDLWRGWPADPLSDEDVIEGLNPVTRRVAEELGAHVVELEHAFPDGYTVDHAVYPDDAGEARIAEVVLASARAAKIGG